MVFLWYLPEGNHLALGATTVRRKKISTATTGLHIVVFDASEGAAIPKPNAQDAEQSHTFGHPASPVLGTWHVAPLLLFFFCFEGRWTNVNYGILIIVIHIYIYNYIYNMAMNQNPGIQTVP